MSGIFIAGIFSAALSSLSTSLNSASAIVLEDFIKPFRKTPLSYNQIQYILKGMVLILGIICLLLVFIVSKLGHVLQLTMSLMGVGAGPLFGVFIMAFMIPWINGKSALSGGVCGLISMIYLVLNAQTDIATGVLTFPKKSFSVEGCEYEFDVDNSTKIIEEITQR